MLTEMEPTHSPNVDTGTIIVPTIRNRTAIDWFEFAFQLLTGFERLFCISDFILSSRRLRLTDKNFEDQVFTHCNADLLGAVCRKRKSACF